MPNTRIQPAPPKFVGRSAPLPCPERTAAPGRLNIKAIENRLAVTALAPAPQRPAPSRDIARTLLEARSAATAPAAVSPASQYPAWQPGALIAKGAEAEVRAAAYLPGQVLKLFKPGIGASDIRAEMDAMNRYHGSGFVQASPDGRSLRMPRLEGVPLHLLPPAQAPHDLGDRILACVERILDAGIYPEDLCEANFLYDPKTGQVAPVDLKSRAPETGRWQDWIASFRGEIHNLMAVAARATRVGSPDKSVRFAEHAQVSAAGGSWRDDSSRVAIRFSALSKVSPALASGAALQARDVRKLLLMSLAANADHQLVSPRSEKLLLRALDEVQQADAGTYAAGSLPFDVLQSFVKRGQSVRPDLFR